VRKRRKFDVRNRLNALTEINVTPLIDLAFALLIIFMIATPLLEQTIPINLPAEAAKPQREVDLQIQVLSIDAQGRFHWGTNPVSDSEMAERLGRLSSDGEQPILRIRADRQLPYYRVIQLIDLVKQHDLVKISLDTEVQ
tara:strand:+ start:219 stop:638 length:420 start_codon:yes stop_codon:yes gene_type:complete